MKRNINLAYSLPKQSTVKLPPDLILRILAAYLAILIIVYGMEWSLGCHKDNVLTKVTSEKELATKQWAMVAANDAVTEKVDERAKFWEQLLEAKGQHYSDFLRDLALQVPYGVWLDNIEIAKRGALIKLSGKTYNSPLTMVLVQNLNSASAFAGKQFKVFNLTVEPLPKNTNATTTNRKLASFIVSTEAGS